MEQITIFGCTLTKFMTKGCDVAEDGYDVAERGNPLGLICKSKETGKWAATWNMVPLKGDSKYKYASMEDAVQRLLDWAQETRARGIGRHDRPFARRSVKNR